MEYFFESKDKYLNVYSCDMLRVTFEMREDCLNNIKRHFENVLRSDIKQYSPCFSEFKYRNMFSVDYGRSTMTVGLVFNGTKKEDNFKGFLEVNPNKCFDSLQAQNDVLFLLSNCVGYSVSRWDLAIDIPCDREFMHMKKDQRKFELSQKSFKDRTEYLGQRNAPGRVKLYNKTLESKLDYSLTRLELTMGGFATWRSDFKKWCPEIWTSNPQLELVDYTGLDSSQRVMCELLHQVDNPEYYLSQLNFRLRKKIEPYILGGTAKLLFDTKCVYEIVTQVEQFLKRSCVMEWGNAQKGTRDVTQEELEDDNPFV